MLGLLRKEARFILPFVGLVLAVIVIGLLYEAFFELPANRSMARAYGDYIALDVGATGLSIGLIFALASGILVREHDEGTIEFLDALPVSRSRLFVGKLLAAMAVILLFVTLDIGTGVLLHAISRTSLDRSFHLPLLATAFGVRVAQLFVVLSIGLAFSFLRRFGWLLLGLVLWMYFLIRERFPGIEIINVFALAKPEFEGSRLIVSWPMMAVQLSLAAMMMTIAYAAFLGHGDRILRGLQRLRQNRLGNGCLISTAILLTILLGALLFNFLEANFGDEDDGSEVSVEYADWTTSRIHTEHYTFLYPTNLANETRQLADMSGPLHDKVRDFLAAETGTPIVVDLTSNLERHAGLAYWEKIRLSAGTLRDPRAAAILGHETTHVFLNRISDNRLTDYFNSTRFFHEGVATYVETHLFDAGETLDQMRRVAAVTYDRKEVRFDELVNSTLLSKRRDSDLVYPLGEVFATAVVQRYGEDAIPKIARAFVRRDAPENLAGEELWRDAFQACGFNLDELRDQFYAVLQSEVEKRKDFVESVPRLRSGVASEDFGIVVEVLGVPEGWRPVCRFRHSENTPSEHYVPGDNSGDGRFYVSRFVFSDPRIWYQIGQQDSDGGLVIYEPWRRATLD